MVSWPNDKKKMINVIRQPKKKEKEKYLSAQVCMSPLACLSACMLLSSRVFMSVTVCAYPTPNLFLSIALPLCTVSPVLCMLHPHPLSSNFLSLVYAFFNFYKTSQISLYFSLTISLSFLYPPI